MHGIFGGYRRVFESMRGSACPSRRCAVVDGLVLSFVLVVAGLFCDAAPPVFAGEMIPAVTRSRVESKDAPGVWVTVERAEEWDASKTAIVVCDMWDKHWCPSATERVGELAPVMNRVLQSARAKGVLIVHSPSETMDHYEGTPQRQLAQQAPKAANLPEGMTRWCSLQSREGKLPIDDSDGGCDCENPPKSYQAWTKQIDTIEIAARDAISDRGDEVWNLLESRGIETVIVMGVHTNMCVLGRPFGIRNLVQAGKRVVLMRDMTDTMYNPGRPPYVSHFRGTDLVVRHIEQYWCPTVASTVFTGEKPFRFREDRRPLVAIVIAESLYKTAETLPRYAAEVLQGELGWETVTIQPDGNDSPGFSGFERVRDADVVLLSVRRRALLPEEMEILRGHLSAGKPLVGIRTASHAFDTRGRKRPGTVEWQAFDPEVLGGSYDGHHRDGIKVQVSATGSGDSSILEGVTVPFESSGSLYRTSPLAEGAEALLIGEIPGEKPEPVAWTNQYGEAKVFYTSLGHPEDFQNPSFRRLLANAIAWSMKD